MVVAPGDLYTSRTTRAVRAVLVEMGQVLASYRGKFAIVGGQTAVAIGLKSRWPRFRHCWR